MAEPGKALESRREQASLQAESTRPRRVFVPRTDIIEKTDSIILFADMPGVDESHVDITLEKGVLTIYGTVDAAYHEDYDIAYAEYSIGDYRRSFTVTDEIDQDKIGASVKDGVLRLTLPKAEKVKPKKITVKTA
ncbi:MAG: Hsp20/alpha crystallin family protein [Deltaproteobacteria bacterium]|nr:Hsp20/alpha crystallin family protein [Deltaproteobacteria bacterium]MBN2686694.1 Hsp20/alpha crystallin family protein [Deltaproteobacteria bacterium]